MILNWTPDIPKDKIVLSILIPSLQHRKEYRAHILGILKPQLTDEIELLLDIDEGQMHIGDKRNELLKAARGKYIVFVDDDDIVVDFYVKAILNAIRSEPDINPDVIGIRLNHFENGKHLGHTIHSIEYDHWFEERDKLNPEMMLYYRNPNHLNPVKRELAMQAKFPSLRFGEDREYSRRLYPLLKNEVLIDYPIYSYMYVTNKEMF